MKNVLLINDTQSPFDMEMAQCDNHGKRDKVGSRNVDCRLSSDCDRSIAIVFEVEFHHNTGTQSEWIALLITAIRAICRSVIVVVVVIMIKIGRSQKGSRIGNFGRVKNWCIGGRRYVILMVILLMKVLLLL